MASAIIALIAALVGMIPWFLNRHAAGKANRNDLGKAESTELDNAMRRVDELYPPR